MVFIFRYFILSIIYKNKININVKYGSTVDDYRRQKVGYWQETFRISSVQTICIIIGNICSVPSRVSVYVCVCVCVLSSLRINSQRPVTGYRRSESLFRRQYLCAC